MGKDDYFGNFTLDEFSVPLALGARVALLMNPFTPSWEKEYLATHPRGALLTSVREIPGYLDGAPSDTETP